MVMTGDKNKAWNIVANKGGGGYGLDLGDNTKINNNKEKVYLQLTKWMLDNYSNNIDIYKNIGTSQAVGNAIDGNDQSKTKQADRNEFLLGITPIEDILRKSYDNSFNPVSNTKEYINSNRRFGQDGLEKLSLKERYAKLENALYQSNNINRNHTLKEIKQQIAETMYLGLKIEPKKDKTVSLTEIKEKIAEANKTPDHLKGMDKKVEDISQYTTNDSEKLNLESIPEYQTNGIKNHLREAIKKAELDSIPEVKTRTNSIDRNFDSLDEYIKNTKPDYTYDRENSKVKKTAEKKPIYESENIQVKQGPQVKNEDVQKLSQAYEGYIAELEEEIKGIKVGIEKELADRSEELKDSIEKEYKGKYNAIHNKLTTEALKANNAKYTIQKDLEREIQDNKSLKDDIKTRDSHLQEQNDILEKNAIFIKELQEANEKYKSLSVTKEKYEELKDKYNQIERDKDALAQQLVYEQKLKDQFKAKVIENEERDNSLNEREEELNSKANSLEKQRDGLEAEFTNKENGYQSKIHGLEKEIEKNKQVIKEESESKQSVQDALELEKQNRKRLLNQLNNQLSKNEESEKHLNNVINKKNEELKNASELLNAEISNRENKIQEGLYEKEKELNNKNETIKDLEASNSSKVSLAVSLILNFNSCA